MYSRPIRPEQDLPNELDNCINRCMKTHRRQALQRIATQQNNQQTQYQQSFNTEQYQNLPYQSSPQSSNTISYLPIINSSNNNEYLTDKYIRPKTIETYN
ncbi:unnamed protein product, partial [Rotaria sp. Silwood2]